MKYKFEHSKLYHKFELDNDDDFIYYDDGCYKEKFKNNWAGQNECLNFLSRVKNDFLLSVTFDSNHDLLENISKVIGFSKVSENE
jgi:hypothetical protein